MNIIQSTDKTILVVDDDPSTCDMLTTILTKQSFQVVSTVHSKDAMNYLRPGAYLKIDLVITDLQMPSYGGFSIIKDLQSGNFIEVPIVVITGRNLDAQTAGMIQMESNVKALFIKPLPVKSFVDKIHEILGTVPPPPLEL